MIFSLSTVAALGAVASAYELPDNLRSLYEAHIIRRRASARVPSLAASTSGAVYCGDIPNAIFLKGPDGDTFGISDLDANLHSYVVFGNERDDPSFNRQDHGVQPLSVMAVICNNQMFYGVWGDTNGFTSTGESSLALAKLYFPNDSLNGDAGHDQKDVLYLAFPGHEAVPGRDGANWNAGSPEEFEDSIKAIGDRLVASLPS